MRAIAFYLPQYHPIPENDAWWGKGFTEWTNVAKARPYFKGHYQPHLPSDLGFYDLRLPEARQAQTDLARDYGIHGFCYYHYWFGGRRLLERPFAEVLQSGKPDFPFCLCWANETWTRRWDGQEQEILLEQTYGDEDDLNHIRWLSKAFSDPRYIRVQGRPLFLVYRFSRLPNPARTIDVWRSECRRLGVGEIFLCNVESNIGAEVGLATQYNLDAAVEFAPDARSTPLAEKADWLTEKLVPYPKLQRLAVEMNLTKPWLREHGLYSYEAVMNNMLAKPAPAYLRFPCVTPSWDNAARRQSGATIFYGSTPELYKKWLTAAAQKAKAGNTLDPVIFINAWNEWAEGNHLEPCQRWSHAYLKATRDALAETMQVERGARASSPTALGVPPKASEYEARLTKQ